MARNKGNAPPPPAGPAPAAKEAPPAPACADCAYWARLDADKGECRALPPVVVSPVPKELLTDKGPLGRFPLTLSSTSCARHPLFATYLP